jgi:hypothetical protein
MVLAKRDDPIQSPISNWGSNQSFRRVKRLQPNSNGANALDDASEVTG